MGYAVQVTQFSNDGGVDVLATRGDQRLGVQCKRYNGSVGVTVVRELRGSMVRFQCSHGIVATTGTFTAAARTEAGQLGVELWDLGTITKHWLSTLSTPVAVLPLPSI